MSAHEDGLPLHRLSHHLARTMASYGLSTFDVASCVPVDVEDVRSVLAGRVHFVSEPELSRLASWTRSRVA